MRFDAFTRVIFLHISPVLNPQFGGSAGFDAGVGAGDFVGWRPALIAVYYSRGSTSRRPPQPVHLALNGLHFISAFSP